MKTPRERINEVLTKETYSREEVTDLILQLTHGIGQLHSKESSLLGELRTNYRFGEVTISVLDGYPQFVIQTVVRKKLG